MYCYNCGENNPDEATYCKNCGAVLRKEETVKKVEIIENQSSNNNTHQDSSSSSNDSSDWIGCCLCLIGIFIVFAIIGLF
ncbi:zinc-ribbon domain-containing protein [uncultured Methanobrevibacter sp.]|uniref:zinc-ribbon domain-containing protein n=1 Tax=uncultured Methanobrevibacter sp. TaxID=253161 RepID=UPI0026239897|nr:zinc-ribbon domain-containing protein [uncultured Methanobrevibacter sp.]